MLKRQLTTGLIASVFVLTLLSITTFTACNRGDNADNYAEDTDYTAYRSYVVSVRDSGDRYYDRDWVELERDYTERKSRLEAKLEKMDDKARAEYNELEQDWNEFKARYDERRAQRENENRITVIRTTFVYPDPADYRYTNLAATDIGEAYKRFFDGFKGDAANYSQEDWREINAIYKALEDRREALKDSIIPKDQDMISTIKKQYASIMANERPFAESENKPQ